MRNRILCTLVLCVASQLVVASVTANLDRAVVRDKFTVEARKYRYFTFTTGAAEVKGRFEAEGGSGNDIEVLLLDRDGFTNWKNGHATKAWYNSGRVTVASVSAKVPRGEYYLIFNNAYSLLTNKVVSADITLE